MRKNKSAKQLAALSRARNSRKSRNAHLTPSPDIPPEALKQKFENALLKEFAAHGDEAVEDLRKRRPWDFLHAVTALHQGGHKEPDAESLSEEQIKADFIRDVRELAAAGMDIRALIDEALAGVGAE
jgi:hypothetical protein